MKNNELEYVEKELEKFQFNRSTIGYKCVKKGLCIAIKQPGLLYNLNNDLYQRIAEELCLNKLRVKWNIERSINQMYINTNMELLMKYFSLNEDEKVTPKLFFMIIIDRYNLV